MLVRFKGRCQRIRNNKDITEILITRRETYGDGWSQEQHALFNLSLGPDDAFREGHEYWIEVWPASPAEIVKRPTKRKATKP